MQRAMQISIHAPSRERPSPPYAIFTTLKISIHAPSRERPVLTCVRSVYSQYFNPRSLTGATLYNYYEKKAKEHFNPRSLTGATLYQFGQTSRYGISIHAPSRERHQPQRRFASPYRDFNPRSLTGATIQLLLREIRISISIHAPSRERPRATALIQASLLFQSTLPHGSDPNERACTHSDAISIHAPSRERPERFAEHGLHCWYFNPRSLTGATLYAAPVSY